MNPVVDHHIQRKTPAHRGNGSLTCIAFAACLSVTVSNLSFAGEKYKINFTKTARHTLSENKLAAGMIPDHEFVAQTFRDTILSNDPKWDVQVELVFNNDRTVRGNGNHRGYSIDYFKNRDEAYCWYEGTHVVTVKDGGAWEVNYQGKCEYFGGTGRFKALKGFVDYKGRITPDSFLEENRGEVEY